MRQHPRPRRLRHVPFPRAALYRLLNITWVQKRIFACASGALQSLVLNVRNRDAADQVRIGDQSQDREDGVWAIASRGATIATLPRKAMNSRRFMDAPPR